MGVVSGCGEQEVGVASGSGWNLWVWLLGVVLRRYNIYIYIYIDFLIVLIPTPLVSVLFCSSIPTFFCFKKKSFSFLFQYLASSSLAPSSAMAEVPWSASPVMGCNVGNASMS